MMYFNGCVSFNTSFMYLLHFTDLGLRQPRLEGEEYLEIIDEFMEAAFTRWPKAVVQVYISLLVSTLDLPFDGNVDYMVLSIIIV